MERTITCPHGCDPSQLERDGWVRVESEKNSVDWEGVPYGTRYTCHACGWEADWNPKQGLMIVDEGHLAPIFEVYE